MLSHAAVAEVLGSGDLGFDGELRECFLLLTLGPSLLEFAQDPVLVDPYIDATVQRGYQPQQSGWSHFDLSPRRAVLIATHEHLQLGPGLAGAIGTLSHLARLGVFSHFCSPFVAPGYEGRLALELLNVSTNTIRLRPGLPVAKVALFRVEAGTIRGHDQPPPWYRNPKGGPVDLRTRFPEEFSSESPPSDG